MKKIIIFLASLFLLVSCVNDYNCVIDYKLVYKDTTFVRHYEFKGDSDATYYIESKNHGKTLFIHPHGAFGYDIARVPNDENDIIVIDYKMYKRGIDIEE